MMRLDSVQFGISDFCTNRCVMCHQSKHYFADRERRFMDVALLRKFLSESLEEGLTFTTLYLFWIGEPMLHPEFDVILEELARYNGQGRIFESVFINTNALDFDHERARHLIDVANRMAPGCTSKIVFSLDAVKSETYSRIRGGNGMTAIRNVEAFIDERAKLGVVLPLAVFQFVVMEENLSEASEFASFWRAKTGKYNLTLDVLGSRDASCRDAVYFRPLLFDEEWIDDPAMKKRHEQLIEAWKKIVLKESGAADPEKLRLALEREAAHPLKKRVGGVCRSAFAAPVISTNGKVTTCCRDFFGVNDLGDISAQSLATIWKSEKAKGLRASFEEGGHESLPGLCRACYMPGENWFSSDAEFREFLSGNEELRP
jgi:hypothetical protein